MQNKVDLLPEEEQDNMDELNDLVKKMDLPDALKHLQKPERIYRNLWNFL